MSCVASAAKSAAPDDAVELIGTARADDGRGDGGVASVQAMAASPGDSAVPRAHRAQALGQRQPLREIRLLEVLGAPPPVVVGGSAATRSRVIVPVSRPDCIGE